MAWNTDNFKSSVKDGATSQRPSSSKRGLLFLALGLVVGAIVAYFLFFSGNVSPETVDEGLTDRKMKVVDVETHVSTNRPVAEKPAERNPEEPPPGVTKGEDGIYRYPGGARWANPKRKRKVVDNRPRVTRLFKHPSETHIACLLEIEPGATVFGSMRYPATLGDDFKAALDEKIEITDEDTPEDVAMKKAVIETKKEIAQRVKNGEDFVEILRSTREELARLGAYRNNLKQEIDRIVRDENYSEQDVKDFETAANTMLEKEGLPKIKAPNMIIRQSLLSRARAKKAKAENAPQNKND